MKKRLILATIVASMLAALSIMASAACDHNYRLDYEKSTEATCTAKGKNVYVCSRCSATKTESVAATGHDYVKASGTEATCEEASTIVEKCSVCGIERKDNTKAIGHKYEETKRVEATCSKEGTVTYKCRNCKGTKTEKLKTVSHDFSKFISSSATCTTGGQSTYQCTMCKELTLKTVSKLGHDYEKTNGPTCTEKGKYTYTCTRCGYSYDSKSDSSALGHELPEEGSSKWSTVKKATCEENGVKRAKCTRCKEYIEEPIEATGHDYSGNMYVVNVPTSASSGKARVACSKCDATSTRSIPKGIKDLSEYKVPVVVASKEDGVTVARGTKIELSCELSGATIYYALGGKSPKTSSARKEYTAPIVITNTETIKAYAVYDGLEITDGDIVTYKFKTNAAEPWVYLTASASDGGYMELEEANWFRPEEYATRYEVIMAMDAIFESWADDAYVSFSDVDKNHKDVVSKFVGAKLLNGYDDGTFRGNDKIKRSELCKVLALALGIEVDTDAAVKFGDVNENHWAYKYIAALTEKGYLAGDTNGNFRPEDYITRAELAVVMNRVAEVEASGGVEISDVKTSHWAYAYICGAVKGKKN